MLPDAVTCGVCAGAHVTFPEEWAADSAPLTVPIALTAQAAEWVGISIDEADPSLAGDVIGNRARGFIVHLGADSSITLNTRWRRTSRLKARSLWDLTRFPKASIAASEDEAGAEQEQESGGRTAHMETLPMR